MLVWPGPTEEDESVGTGPVDETPGRGVEAALLEEPAPVEPGGSGVELGCSPGVDGPGGITGSLELEDEVSGMLDTELDEPADGTLGVGVPVG